MADPDEDPDAAGGPPETRPPPPSIWRILGVGLVVLVFLLASPALYAAGRDLGGSPIVGVLGLLPLAAAVVVLYMGLFR